MADEPKQPPPGLFGTLTGLIGNWVQKLAQWVGIPYKGHGGRPGPRILTEQFLGADEWLEKGYWAVTVSSNVSAIRYDKPHLILYVAFTGVSFTPTRVYKYLGVPPQIAERMFLAPSVGKFVHQVLKGAYPFAPPGTYLT